MQSITFENVGWNLNLDHYKHVVCTATEVNLIFKTGTLKECKLIAEKRSAKIIHWEGRNNVYSCTLYNTCDAPYQSSYGGQHLRLVENCGNPEYYFVNLK